MKVNEHDLSSPEARYVLSGDAGEGAKKALLFLLEKRGKIGNILRPIRLGGKDIIRNPGLREGIREAGRALRDYREGWNGAGIPDTDYNGLVEYFSGRGAHYAKGYVRQKGILRCMFYRERYAAAIQAMLYT
jgi:hypothetical protein